MLIVPQIARLYYLVPKLWTSCLVFQSPWIQIKNLKHKRSHTVLIFLWITLNQPFSRIKPTVGILTYNKLCQKLVHR